MSSERMANTEKIQAIVASSTDRLCAYITQGIEYLHMRYMCEITLDTFPKTRVEYTIKWLKPLKDGILLAQFVECSQPMRITTPLRIWTIL